MDKKTELEKWSEKHPAIISNYSKYMSIVVDSILGYLEIIIDKNYFESFGDIPNLNEWLDCYNDEDFAEKHIRKIISEAFDNSSFSKDLIKFSDQYSDDIINFKHHDSKIDVLEEQIHLKESKTSSTNFIKSLVEKFDTIFPESDKKKKVIFQNIESQFIAIIYLPCLLFFGEPPYDLFKKAQKGSEKALNKIIRLDPSILGDSLIIEYFHSASKKTDRSLFNNLISSLKIPPKRTITLQKVKYKFAGLISSFSGMLGYKLTVPEIEKLFKALSIDLNRPEFELVESDDLFNDSIARQIRREKHFWEKRFYPDKK